MLKVWNLFSVREHVACLFTGSASLALCVCLAGASAGPQKPAEIHSPLSPLQALPHFRIAPGVRVELVAAEPTIQSPVAMAFDEDGRLWVVEMEDYPNGPPPGKAPEGRIRILEDREGDGRYEHSTVFADHLLFANGLLPWRDGVLVTAAPYIIHLRDTNHDGKVDTRDRLFEGFAAENPQLRVSHPVLGLDNWLYVANGLRGGQVRRSGRPSDKPINISGMDFRFDLSRDRHEAISGMGQYGNAFDDWGRRFVCDNHHHVRHIVLPNRCIQRNPFLAVPEVVEDISVLQPGIAGAGAQVYPLSKNWTTSNLHSGHFTAACSVHIYRGNLLPAEFRDNAFTCEPTGNLVHREVLKQHGATFQSRPPRPGVEFLATPDDWFRPVNLADGPDGALYVVDMYRAVIEHPEFMPPELQKRPDLTAGKDRGRIWRIVPDNQQVRPVKPHLSTLGSAELVRLLAHPDGWWRITAQRLLLTRDNHSEAIEPLRSLVVSSGEPRARLLAAWLLEHFGKLDDQLVSRLLQDKHPRCREQGILLAESYLSKVPAIQEQVLALASDSDPQVRFQVALSLGEWDSPRILEPLVKLLLSDLNDRWVRWAVASSVPRRAGALLVMLLGGQDGLANAYTPERVLVLRELCALIGARQEPSEVADVIKGILQMSGPDTSRWQMAGLNGLADGMGRRGTQLDAFIKRLPDDKDNLHRRVEGLFKSAAALAGNKKSATAERIEAIHLLAHAPWPVAEPVCSLLLNDSSSQDARLAAVAALGAHSRPEVPRILMKSWTNSMPAVRREIIETMLRQPERTLFLLNEVEAGRVKAGDLDAARMQQLVGNPRPEIRSRAQKLLKDKLPADRKKIIDQYRGALALRADPLRGREVFRKNCSTCHHVAGIGIAVGPDISDTRTKTAEGLLVDILNPNQAIDSNYINYIISTKNGKVMTGVIATETASSITLKRAENQQDVVLRQDIDEIHSTGQSLMPEGLEKTIRIEDMGDLLSFLKNWRYLGGDVPLGSASTKQIK